MGVAVDDGSGGTDSGEDSEAGDEGDWVLGGCVGGFGVEGEVPVDVLFWVVLFYALKLKFVSHWWY